MTPQFHFWQRVGFQVMSLEKAEWIWFVFNAHVYNQVRI